MTQIRRLQCNDAEWMFIAVARLHIGNIFHGMLPLLGEKFLASLYRQLTNAPDAGIWIAEENDQVVAFVAGCCDLGLVFRSVLLNSGPAFLLRGAIGCLRPSVLRRLPAVLLYPFQSARIANNADRADDVEKMGEQGAKAELLALAVAAEWRRKKIGNRLMNAMEQELFRARNISQYVVTTNKAELASNRFYTGTGFKPDTTFHHHRLILQRYRKQVSQSNESS